MFKTLTLATKNRLHQTKLLNGFPEKILKSHFTIEANENIINRTMRTLITAVVMKAK
jgi:hypothetical protein